MWDIVTDERRSPGGKSASPPRGRVEASTGDVPPLVRATSPAGTALLASRRLPAIPAIVGGEYRP